MLPCVVLDVPPVAGWLEAAPTPAAAALVVGFGLKQAPSFKYVPARQAGWQPSTKVSAQQMAAIKQELTI